VFAVICATEADVFYFNFNQYEGVEVLPESVLEDIRYLYMNVRKTVFMANAKFDLHFLEVDPNKLHAKIYDVLTNERLIDNSLLSYSLANVAKRYGYEKLDTVEEYIKEHGLYEWQTIPGKKSRLKNKFYARVPFEIIQPYGEADARVTYDIGRKQLAELERLHLSEENVPYESWSNRKYERIVELESKIIPICYKMERDGIMLDRQFCEIRAKEETEKYEKAARNFKDLTGEKFLDSGKALARVFEKIGIEVPRTEKGNPSITDDWLEESDNSLSVLIKEYRQASKIANTYYKNYLFFMDSDGVIRPNMKPSGTATGRFSYSDPNLQNVPSDSEVRKAFVPRPNYYFASIDFSQQEFRMALDYAGEFTLAEMISNGLDAHDATAELAKITRKQAKTLNFAVLYGSGGKKIASMIGVSEDEGKEFRRQYFKALPFLSGVIKRFSGIAKNRHYLRTWAGRILRFPEGDFSYKGMNAVIQGGCADVSKFAMVELSAFLKNKKSRMVLQVHDEFIFEIHNDEKGIEKNLAEIMENVYPYRILKLTTSISTSEKSWGDIE